MKIHIRVSGPTPAASAQLTGELARVLNPAVQSTERIQEKPEYQDLGATLALVLGTPACLAVAKGLHDFIAKRGNKVEILTERGRVIAVGDASKNIDVAATVAALELHTK
ncbi:MAG: hypothetical protein H7Y60_15015 [Rhodospirillaceae bacterium]|nr:hypothetical protein [Rhodospirillales bacterium]